MPNYPIPAEIYDQSSPQYKTTTLLLDDFLSQNKLPFRPRIIDACCGTGRFQHSCRVMQNRFALRNS